MRNSPIKAIVWDLDGTLIHFKIDWLRARRETIKILKKHGVPKHLLTVKSSILENIRLAREYFGKAGYTNEETEKIIKIVDNVVNDIEYEAALEATAVNGIDKVLEFIKKKNLKQAIYTFNTHRNATTSLEKIGMIGYFNIIIGRDDVKNTKPHPEHLTLICNKLNVKPSDIIVIGDNHRDIEGALNVGAKSIALKTKLTKLTNLKILEKADKIIEESEIPAKLIHAIEDFL
ncbi:MAG: HAD family hydrolase [Promethearchaeota archaeon]